MITSRLGKCSWLMGSLKVIHKHDGFYKYKLLIILKIPFDFDLCFHLFCQNKSCLILVTEQEKIYNVKNLKGGFYFMVV